MSFLVREYAKGKGGHLVKRTDTYDNPWKNRRAAPPQFINTPVTTVSQNVSDRLRRRSERASFPTYSKLCADGGIFVLCTLGLSFGGRGSRSFNSLKRWRVEGLGGDAAKGAEVGSTLLGLLEAVWLESREWCRLWRFSNSWRSVVLWLL